MQSEQLRQIRFHFSSIKIFGSLNVILVITILFLWASYAEFLGLKLLIFYVGQHEMDLAINQFLVDSLRSVV